MKTKRLHTILVLFFLTSIGIHTIAQSTYIRTFEGVNAGSNSHVAVFSDGGAVVVTNWKSETTGLWVMRYDACDELMWSKGLSYDKANLVSADVVVTEEDEVLITGYYNEEGNYESFLVKMNMSGDVLFSNSYETSANEYIYSIGQMSNGNYFMYGNHHNPANPTSSNMVLTFDKGGEIVWGNTYFNIPIWGRTIATSDGGILARTGRVIYKLDDQGAFEWGRELSGTSYYESIPVEVEDGYVYARYSVTNDQNKPAYLFKVGFNGDLIWVSDGFKSVNVLSLVALQNGNFIVPGSIQVDSLGATDLQTMYTRFNSTGQLIDQWLQIPANNEVYSAKSIGRGTNGDVFLVGTDPINEKLMISKINASATNIMACEVTAVSERLLAENLSLSPISITPHKLAAARLAITLETTDLSATMDERCYQKEDLTLYIGKDSLLCPGNELIVGSDKEFPYYKWSTGATSRSIEITKAGTYFLETGNGCETIADTIKIGYFPEADQRYTIEPKDATPLRPVNFSGVEGYDITWKFNGKENNDASFEYTFPENGTFPIVYSFTDENGCFYSDTSAVVVKYHTFYVPKAFTPNQDGVNDAFRPVGFGIRNYQMDIYTRWGDHIYSAQNGEWDGTFNGNEMPVDGYVYEIELEDEQGEKNHKRGVVIMLR